MHNMTELGTVQTSNVIFDQISRVPRQCITYDPQSSSEANEGSTVIFCSSITQLQAFLVLITFGVFCSQMPKIISFSIFSSSYRLKLEHNNLLLSCKAHDALCKAKFSPISNQEMYIYYKELKESWLTS
jgi:hypothetical protein